MTSIFPRPANPDQSAVARIALVSLLPLLAICPLLRANEPDVSGYQPFELRSARAEDVALELQKSLQGKAQVLIDRQGNRVLVQGTQQHLRIAEHLIRQIDVQAATSVKRSYSVRPESIERVANQLRYRYANSAGVQVSVDSLAGAVAVTAPAETHREISALLGGLGSVPTEPSEPKVRHAAPLVSRSYQLRTASADAVLDKLKSTWGSKLQLQALGRGEQVRVRLSSERKPQTTVEIDQNQDVVRLEGPEANVESWQLLLKSLDQPAEFRSGNAQLVPARQSDSDAIRKAVALAQALSDEEKPSADILELISEKGRPGWGGRLVSMIFQPEDVAGQETEDNNGADDNAGQAPDDDESGLPDGAGGGLLGTVRIEFLEGLDIMIIRGHPEDVARVTKIIQQIQDEAIGTQPDVQIVPLRHVSSRAVYGVLNDLYEQVYAPRQGPVSITPLIKPNALLLVGRPENNQSVVSLLRQLDVPVPPATEIEVIQLKWMSAVDAAQRINDHYNTQPPSPNQQDPSELIRGLSLRVRVTADYRSNAIILQASPRDMAEVKRFIRKIDVEGNKSLHEVKIIPLKNALAADLAPVLQDAINGQLQGAGRATSGETQLQQQQAQQTPAQVRSAMLQFLTVDRDGTQSHLKSGILFGVRVIADQNRNALIVIGPSNSMPLLEALIDELDQLPNASAQIKVFTIVNGDATNLAIMLQQLFGQEVTAGTGSFGQASFVRSAFQAGTATAGGEGSLVPIRFAIDQRTNSIVASGSESDLSVVEAILARLDEDGIETRRNIVYRLQNAPALDVATAITDVLAQQRQASLSALTGVLSPAEQFEREVFIVPEPVSNSLIISSTPRYFDNIVQIIKDLDQRPPMVMIQTVIAEVSYGDAFEFGFETGFQDSLVFNRGLQGGVEGTQPLVGFPFNQSALGNDTTPGSLATRENLAGQILSNLSVGRTSGLGLGYGGLILTAGNESVNFLLRALQNNRAAQILARPQIMTLDNQVAFVQIGARVARVLGGSTTPQGGTTQNVEDVDVGVILRVQPRISPDGTVVMLLDTERSEVSATEGTTVGFSAEGTPLISPNINTTTAQTTLSARSGQTVVFAGLMQKTKSFERRSLPWLGHLPGIGWLFRYDQEQEQRRELLIFMTPYVIKDDEDYEWINRVEMDRMSWCLSDVVQMHGNLGPGITPAYWDSAAPAVVYPALDPTGTESIQPRGIESPDLPQPLPQSSSRRTSDRPTPVQSTFNGPSPGDAVTRLPFAGQKVLPSNSQSRDYFQAGGQPASYAPHTRSSGRPSPVDTQDYRTRPIPPSDPDESSEIDGSFIPSYLPANDDRADFGRP